MSQTDAPIFDLQINGWRGIDLNDDQLSGEKLHHLCLELAERGVTRFLATLITDQLPLLEKRTHRLASLIAGDPLAAEMIAGIHLEGPFLNPRRGFIGAHQPECVLPASPEVAARLHAAALGKLVLMTLAPECDPGAKTIGWLSDHNVRVAAGHCDSSLDQLRAAIDAGLTLYTHLGNACPAELPRHDNIVQRVLSLADQLYITFIADGQHLPWFALGNYLRLVGPERAILISDVTAAGGMPPGLFSLNRRPVLVDELGVARLADQPQLLAGSTCLLADCRQRVRQELGLSAEWLQRLTWTNPTQALGGRLHPSRAENSTSNPT